MEPNPALWTALVGDDTDPVYRDIAAALPAAPHFATLSALASTLAEKPTSWPAVVLHRPNPCFKELVVAAELWRASEKQIRLFLCTSLTARYHQLEAWNIFCEALLPEATAPDTIARRVLSGRHPSNVQPSQRRRVAIVSTDFEMRMMLADLCQRSGFISRPARTWDEARPAALAVWDVPVLDPTWPAAMRREGRRRRILALSAFCDRGLVSLMKQQGAKAVLDLPCNAEDFSWLLERLGSVDASTHVAHTPHVVAPAPHSLQPDEATSPSAHGHSWTVPLK